MHCQFLPQAMYSIFEVSVTHEHNLQLSNTMFLTLAMWSHIQIELVAWISNI